MSDKRLSTIRPAIWRERHAYTVTFQDNCGNSGLRLFTAPEGVSDEQDCEAEKLAAHYTIEWAKNNRYREHKVAVKYTLADIHLGAKPWPTRCVTVDLEN